jgi:hypothetical protein
LSDILKQFRKVSPPGRRPFFPESTWTFSGAALRVQRRSPMAGVAVIIVAFGALTDA